MTGRSYAEVAILVVGLAAAIASGVIAWRLGGPYGEKFAFDPRVKRIYSPTTGALESMAVDADGDLVFDTWHYLDGDRLTRIDFDDDQDGTIDRRQHYGADGRLERTESLATGAKPAPAGPRP